MALFEKPEYTESTWRNDDYSRERAQARRDEIERDDFYAPRIAVVPCDGGGIVEEYYFDVDQTRVVRCPGCDACYREEAFLRRRELQAAATSDAGIPVFELEVA